MNYVLIMLILFILFIYILFRFVLNNDLNRLNKIIFGIVYFIVLITILLNREKKDTSIFSDGSYIKTWIKLLFTNKTVFINIIGNIIIYIPLGIILSLNKRNIIISFLIMVLIIVLFESLQYISKRGIFDILDILLNLLGSVIGYSLEKIYTHRKKR